MKQPWKRKPKTKFGVPASKIKRALTKRASYAGSKEAWRELARKVFIRDNYTCCKCKRHRSKLAEDETLECHHIKRVSRGGTDSVMNLITLCSRCHAKQPGHSHLK